jgi:hypothetical protein
MSTPGTMTKVPGTVLQTNMSVIQTPFVSQHRGGDGRISECCDTCGIPYVTALDMNLVKNLRTIGFCTTKARVLGLYSLSQSHFKRSKVHPWLPMTLALFFERFQRHAPVYRHTKCTKNEIWTCLQKPEWTGQRNSKNPVDGTSVHNIYGWLSAKISHD